MTESTHSTEQDAKAVRREFSRQGREVSLIAYDPARDLYVFDVTVNKCRAHNGSYSCDMSAGHSGRHETRPYRSVYYTFKDNYSQVVRRVLV